MKKIQNNWNTRIIVYISAFIARLKNEAAKNAINQSTMIYLTRVRKKMDEEISGKFWWCGRFRMSCTQVFVRCMHPKLEKAPNEIY
jgi:hypothetical protein